MLAALLTTLAGATSIGDFLPALTPVSFDPSPRNESYVAVDSSYSGSSWSEVAGSRVVQTVASKDAATGRPTSQKIVSSVAGVADTSTLAYTWLTSEVFKTLSTSIKYNALTVPLTLTSSASTASEGSTTQDLSIQLMGATKVSRDTLTWNAKGMPLFAKVQMANLDSLLTYMMSGKVPPLHESQRSVTRYAADDTTPVYRFNEGCVGGLWLPVDSSTVTLEAGRPSILTRWDSAGKSGTFTRDSLVWEDGRLSKRIRSGSITSFTYDAQGRVLTRTTSSGSGEALLPVSRTSYSYESNLSIGRRQAGSVLSILSTRANRSAVLRLETSAVVRVSVHAVDGRLLGLLADGQMPAGTSSFSLNGIRGAAIVKVTGAGISATATIPSL